MTKSKILLFFCLSFIIGIFLASISHLTPHLYISGGLVLAILLISVFWRYKKIVIVGSCLLFLVAGIWRYQIVESRVINSQLRKFNDLENSITLNGTVVKESDVRESNIKLTVKVESINENVLVTTQRYPEYNYGDKLKITGKLKSPQIFEDFNYKDYLAKEGIYSVTYWPKIELIGKNQANFFYSKILFFKNKLREKIYSFLSPPKSSILGAIILGDKRRISDDWKNKLNITGVRHITCISGMHIIILSGILMWLGIALGLWRGQAFYFAIILLILFIIMVGAPPSAIRAGIMGGIFLFAQKIGRLRSGGRAITMAATAMLVYNPLLLKSDVGFQLSFLATLGIIYLMPIFQYWFKKIPNPKTFPLKNLLAMTLAAQIFTLPILIYNFGYMSLVAPITNVLIVPLLPYIMILGFIFGLIAMIWQSLAWLFFFPLWFVLAYLTKIIDFFSNFSFSSLTLEISWVWLLISYLILGLITWRLEEKQKLKFLSY